MSSTETEFLGMGRLPQAMTNAARSPENENANSQENKMNWRIEE
jgi:hypothetical protein